MTQASAIDACSAQLRQLLGNDFVHDDVATRQFFSTDIFYVAEPCALVIAPGNTEELGAAVAITTEAGLAVVPRGGGMSYTRGYLGGPGSVLIDTQRMNRASCSSRKYIKLQKTTVFAAGLFSWKIMT